MKRKMLVCVSICFLFIITSCYSCFAENTNTQKLNSTYEPPINIIFNIHIEPMDIMPDYFSRRIEVNWLRDTAIDYGAKLSLVSNGEYMEYCIENNHQGDFLKYLNAGFDVGTHSHLVSHNGPHNWISHHGEDLTYELVDKIISDNEFFVDKVIGVENNFHICTQTNKEFLDEMMEKHDFLFIAGPGEEGYSEFGHMAWNPFRPSTDDDYPLKENLDTKFITIPHLAQIGSNDTHGMNLSIQQMKRRFLMIYLEWKNRVKNNIDDKVWVWGWCTHPCFNLRAQNDIIEMLSWLNENFINKKDEYGNTIAVYSTASNIYQQYLYWGENNPGISMFNYMEDDPYPYTYEAMPILLENATYDTKIDFDENLNIYRLIKDDKNIYIIWTNQDTVTIDFRDEMAGKLRCTDGHGNSYFQLSKNLEVKEEPLFVEFYRKSFNKLDYIPQFFKLFKFNPIFFYNIQFLKNHPHLFPLLRQIIGL